MSDDPHTSTKSNTDNSAQKWRYIRDMWAGLGFFLVVFGLFIALPWWEKYQDSQTNQAKIEACSHATDVAGCINSIGR